MTDLYKVNASGLALNETVSCTGNQISILLKETEDLTRSLIWYGVDLFAPGKYKIELFGELDRKQTPLKIGSTEEVVRFVSSVPQFERGLFLAVEEKLKEPVLWSPDEFDTEDVDYIEPSVLIIRAFDTSYLEIVSKRKDIIDRITKRLQK